MTDKAPAQGIELPPLPPPFKKAVYATSANTKSVRDGFELGGYEKVPPLFDDAQMLEYARAAVLADRKRRGEFTKEDYYGTYDDDFGFNLRGFYSNEKELIAKGLIIPLYTHPQPADKVRELETILNAIFAHCKVVYFPKDGEYPLEHNPAAKKDNKSDILKAIRALKGEK